MVEHDFRYSLLNPQHTLIECRALAPGLYQVTVSDDAWIDVSQDGKTTRSPVANTMRPGCRIVAKSVRFQLGTAPITIVVSGAKADTIRIAVAPAE